jgi:ABC-type multidrug transport system permease subunit
MILRAIGLTVANEVRLLYRDPVVLLMLLLAPVVIITVAGYSLGRLYERSSQGFALPVVDHDGGTVARELLGALGRDSSVRVEMLDDLEEARSRVRGGDRSPLAIEIPEGTSRSVAAGHTAHLFLYVDAARRLEVNAFEIELGGLLRQLDDEMRSLAQGAMSRSEADLEREIARMETSIRDEQARIASDLDRLKASIADAVRSRVGTLLDRARREAEVLIRERGEGAWSDLRRQMVDREKVLVEVERYLGRLEKSRRAFQSWLADLLDRAGRHASEIPPPPAFPDPPSDTDLALLVRPIRVPDLTVPLPAATAGPEAPPLELVHVPAFAHDPPAFEGIDRWRRELRTTLPGGLDLVERPAVDGAPVMINAFDQYVPGFGITFLLIGMMLGVSLTLFDEREWGTLDRLEASGVAIAGVLLGKVLARFAVGVVQIVVLFAVGWALFDISLGREPIALFLPTVAMSFAAASLGLVVSSLASAHDSVMPLGTMTSMALSAIGGCWWPLGFEPEWMRAIARWLPTTWTMQAYNDLMIRRMPPSAALSSAVMTLGIGLLFLVVGVFAAKRRS